MRLRLTRLSSVIVLLSWFVVLCRAPTAFAGNSHYPLTMQNCGRSITFAQKPQSVVAIGQNSAEILYMLGLGDKVKATALWYTPVLPQFAELNKKVKMLTYNEPSFESVIAEKPAMIANALEWIIGQTGVVGTYEQFAHLGIPVYTAPADCIAKDNQAGGDGLRSQPFDMAMIYQEIRELALIFDVSERGERLVTALKAREAAARARVSAIAGKKLSAVFWYSSADLDMDPYVAGRMSAPGYMMRSLGISNIIQSDHEWPAIGWESIARANPDMIILAHMTRRRFPADDVALKRHYLQTDPVTRHMPAVKAGRIVEMDAQAMNSSIRVIDGLEQLADALHMFGLDQ